MLRQGTCSNKEHVQTCSRASVYKSDGSTYIHVSVKNRYTKEQYRKPLYKEKSKQIFFLSKILRVLK